MATMSQEEWTSIARGMRAFTGHGTCPWPRWSAERLTGEVGELEAARLLPTLERLANDFYASDAWRTPGTLTEITQKASRQFAERNPGAPVELLETLEWCYSFDHR